MDGMTMPKLRAMPLYVEDLLSDAEVDQMDAETFGAYMRLLCYAWKEEGLPTDPERLARLARVSTKGGHWLVVWKRVSSKWNESRPGVLTNSKQERIREAIKSHSQAQSNRAKSRWDNDAGASPPRNASESESVSETVHNTPIAPKGGESDSKPRAKKSKSQHSADLTALMPDERRLVTYWQEQCHRERTTPVNLDIERLRACLNDVVLAGEYEETTVRLAALAIRGCSLSDFHMGRKPGFPAKRNDLSLIFRDAKHVREFVDIALAAKGGVAPIAQVSTPKSFDEQRQARIDAESAARPERKVVRESEMDELDRMRAEAAKTFAKGAA